MRKESSMNKRVNVNIDKNDLRSFENYFEEMSKKGLHLVNFRNGSAEFESGIGRSVRYRIIPIDTEKLWPDVEMIDHFRENGWESVCPYNGYFHIFSASDEDSPELHTDISAEKNAYGNIFRRMKSNSVRNFVLFAIACLLYVVLWQASSKPTVFLIKNAPFLLLYAGILMVIIYDAFHKHHGINNLRRKAETGELFINDGKIRYIPMWKMNMRLSGIIAFAMLVVMVMNTGESYTGFYYPEMLDEPVPCVEVSHLAEEDLTDCVRDIIIHADSSFLGKVFEFNDYCYVTTSDDPITGKDFKYTCHTNSYIPLFPSFASRIAEELISEYPDRNYEKIEDERFDEIYISYSYRSVIAAKDGVVLSVSYRFGEDIMSRPLEENLHLILTAFDYERK